MNLSPNDFSTHLFYCVQRAYMLLNNTPDDDQFDELLNEVIKPLVHSFNELQRYCAFYNPNRL